MAEKVLKVEPVEVKDEFRVCPECGYERGFHVSFVRKPGAETFGLILICTGCGGRYDVGKSV